MTAQQTEQTENPKFRQFIHENSPDSTAFQTVLEPKQEMKNEALKIPCQLKSHKENRLLKIAFRYLFHLNVARETRTPLDVEKLPAIKGNRLVKQKHPLNLIYDFQYVAAKTQIKGYLHNKPYTVPYNQRALRIYGRCYLFAQLDLVAQTGVVPDKLGSDFYFLPKGSFIDEFEQMNKLAMTTFIPQLSSDDKVQLQPALNESAQTDQLHSFQLNDCLVLVDTSETLTEMDKKLKNATRQFFLQKLHEKSGPAPSAAPFAKAAIYRARYGHLEQLDFETYYGETLEEKITAVQQLFQ